MIDLRLLIKNGVHFGHQTSRWSPKMEPYIWGYKNDIHLIDVSKTAYQLEQAAKFLESLAAEGKTMLWVGTKKAAQEIVEKTAQDLNLPYVAHRWVGGTFSNYRQVRKSIANLLHYEDILKKSEQFPYSKKELTMLKKRHARLNNIVGGIRNLTWPVGAVVVVDVRKEHVCVREALTMGIPVVALVDTNSNPTGIDYVIPANDDAPRSISVVTDYLAEAIRRGQAVAAARSKEELPPVEIVEMVVGVAVEPVEGDAVAKKAAAARPAKKAVSAKVPEKKPDSGAAKAAKPKTAEPQAEPVKAAAKKESKKAAEPQAKPAAAKKSSTKAAEPQSETIQATAEKEK